MSNNDNDNTQSTQIVRTEGFTAIETRQNAETAAITMAAKVRANIEAACIMAERHPRDWLNVRTRMLNECKRPGFCEAAMYKLPRRKYNQDTGQWEDASITGFSIRFAEAALRYMTNMSAGSEVVYEDDEKQMVLVTVRDYEANTSVEISVNVPKRIEKKKLKKGERPLSTRVNSYGDTVYIMPATDDEVAMKHNSLVSKAIRNALLRMLPGDISDECEEAIARTKLNKHAEDPQAAIKKVVDTFSSINVMPDQLTTYVGHSLETLSPKELDELRGLYVALKEGEITWPEALDAKTGGSDASDEQSTGRNAAVEGALAKAKEKVDAKRSAKAQPTAPAPENPPTTSAPRMREPGED
jgi:hypothetical protein